MKHPQIEVCKVALLPGVASESPFIFIWKFSMFVKADMSPSENPSKQWTERNRLVQARNRTKDTLINKAYKYSKKCNADVHLYIHYENKYFTAEFFPEVKQFAKSHSHLAIYDIDSFMVAQLTIIFETPTTSSFMLWKDGKMVTQLVQIFLLSCVYCRLSMDSSLL